MYGASQKKSLVEVLREADLISEQEYHQIHEKILAGWVNNPMQSDDTTDGDHQSESQGYRQILNEIEKAGESEEAIISDYVSPKVLELAKKGREFGTPVLQLADVNPEQEALDKVTASFAYRKKIVPVHIENNVLTVAIADVQDVMLIDEIQYVTECEINILLADEDEISDAIVRLYGKSAASLLSAGIKGPVGAAATIERERIEDFGIDEKDLSEDPTVVNAVDQMIIDAVRAGASDIHIEPYPEELKIRYRVDGVLEDQEQPPPYLQSAITSRVKIMAGMDVAERRRPQDGKINKEIASLGGGRQIDLRVSTVPTVATQHSESVVLRILDRQSIEFGLAELGLTDDNFELFQRMIHKPHGIILATGPTGSGKTTTLYACLKEINTPHVKIITLEDPVEYELEGINQIQVNPDISFTFADGLRHILRQDPDKVLVGEIRDHETAEMAIHTSLTGHLVFSTLHTNDAPGAITRLIDMGVEPYLVASTVEGIIAQRLARRVCKACCEMYKPSEKEIAGIFNNNGVHLQTDLEIPRANDDGCKECRGRGYRGRIGIFEVIFMSEELRAMALEQPSTSELRRLAVKLGMKSLREDGWRKVVSGLTTIDEILRLTQEDVYDFDEDDQSTAE
ncbi:type II/IV secretion system protein [Candidatus Poribacteria bacterium]|nr:type II/IV secretion system protein [Candidatus Poribacteria bacterium]